MTEQIKVLAEKAGFKIIYVHGSPINEYAIFAPEDEPIDGELNKFAELIVDKCASVVENLKITAEHQLAMDALMEIVVKEILHVKHL